MATRTPQLPSAKLQRCKTCHFPIEQHGCTQRRCKTPKWKQGVSYEAAQKRREKALEHEAQLSEQRKAYYRRPCKHDLWKDLDARSRPGGSNDSLLAVQTRTRALEWLRLESLYRSWSDREIATFETTPNLAPLEYFYWKAGKHDCLLTERPLKFWPFHVSAFYRAFERLPAKLLAPLELRIEEPGPETKDWRGYALLRKYDTLYFHPDRVLISFDPHSPINKLKDSLCRLAQKASDEVRDKQKRIRTRGAGRPPSLWHMAEALWAHDQLKLGLLNRQQIGQAAQSFEKPVLFSHTWDLRGGRLIQRATEMIRIASKGQAAWFQTFK